MILLSDCLLVCDKSRPISKEVRILRHCFLAQAGAEPDEGHSTPEEAAAGVCSARIDASGMCQLLKIYYTRKTISRSAKKISAELDKCMQKRVEMGKAKLIDQTQLCFKDVLAFLKPLKLQPPESTDARGRVLKKYFVTEVIPVTQPGAAGALNATRRAGEGHQIQVAGFGRRLTLVADSAHLASEWILALNTAHQTHATMEERRRIEQTVIEERAKWLNAEVNHCCENLDREEAKR